MPETESLLLWYGFSTFFIVFIFGLISLCEGICFGKISKNEAKAHAAIVLLFAVFWPLMLFVAIISSPFWVAYLAYQRYKELPEEQMTSINSRGEEQECSPVFVIVHGRPIGPEPIIFMHKPPIYNGINNPYGTCVTEFESIEAAMSWLRITFPAEEIQVDSTTEFPPVEEDSQEEIDAYYEIQHHVD